MKKIVLMLSLVVMIFTVITQTSPVRAQNYQTVKSTQTRFVTFGVAGINHMEIENQIVKLYKNGVYQKDLYILGPEVSGENSALYVGQLEHGNWSVQMELVAYRLFDNARYEYKKTHNFIVDSNYKYEVLKLTGVRLKNYAVKVWLKKYEYKYIEGVKVDLYNYYNRFTKAAVKYDSYALRYYLYYKSVPAGYWTLKLDTQINYSDKFYMYYKGDHSFNLNSYSLKEVYFETYVRGIGSK